MTGYAEMTFNQIGKLGVRKRSAEEVALSFRKVPGFKE
jgi:hypothetical protein